MSKETAKLTFRHEAKQTDPGAVRNMVEGTGFFSAAEADVATELVDERLGKGAASGYEFVFCDDGDALVGYACFGEIPCTVGSFDLYWIVVDANRQREGIGRMLLDESERLIVRQRGRHIYIETSGRPQYHSTRNFYLRCGYDEAAVFADFYGADDAKVVYRKVLA